MFSSDVLLSLGSAAIGSLIALLASYISVRRHEKFTSLEKQRERVAEALQLSAKILDTFTSYRPVFLANSNFGLKIESDYENRIRYAMSVYDDAKYIEYLLPVKFRNRWDQMLILVSEFETIHRLDDVIKNRALCDAQNYIQYVRKSLLDFLDEQDVRPDYPRPYLQRESLDNWEETTRDR